MKKRILFYTSAIAALVIIGFFSTSRREVATGLTMPKSAKTVVPAEKEKTHSDSGASSPRPVAVPKQQVDFKQPSDIYDVLRSGGTKGQMVAELSVGLTSSNPDLGILAAELLLALGDHSGVALLYSTLRDTSALSRQRLKSAILLDRYGLRLDYQDVSSLYEATHDAILVRIMAMQKMTPAVSLITKLQADWKAGGSYYFLGFVDKDGVCVDKALAARGTKSRRESAEISLYLYMVTNRSQYLAEVFSLVDGGAAMSSDPGTVKSSADVDIFNLLAGIRSAEARAFLRKKLDSNDAHIATASLVGLFDIHHDNAFLDDLIVNRLGAENPSAGFDERAFWRIVARRANINDAISHLVSSKVSREVRNAYFSIDAELVNAYWVGQYLPYRPLE